MFPALKFSVEETSVHDGIEKLSAEFGLTENERPETLQSGKHVIRSCVEWAITYLAQAGLVLSPGRGTFKITDQGIASSNQRRVRIEFLYHRRLAISLVLSRRPDRPRQD